VPGQLGPARAPAADGEGSDASESSDGSDSDQELKEFGPAAPRRASMRHTDSNVSDGADGGAVLEIYYRSSFSRTFMTYTLDGTNWTHPPGEIMGRRSPQRTPTPRPLALQ
jgi:hypothetical protein